MDAIIRKVLPITYNHKDEVLYFDTLKSFNSENFTFLKKIPDEHPTSDWATHFISLKDESEFSGNKELHKLIREIKKMINNKTFKMGVPIRLQLDDGKIIITNKKDEDKEFVIQDKHLKFNHRKNINLIARPKDMTVIYGLKMHLIAVGQGLSFIDKTNDILYDVGGDGSIKFADYKAHLIPKVKYTVIISHWHYDHYKFLKKLVDDGSVDKIILNNDGAYGGTRALKTFEKILLSGVYFEQAVDSSTIGPYNVVVPPVDYDEPNNNSIVIYSDKWLLTGDQNHSFIECVVKKKLITRIKNYQIPHHGSSNNGANSFMHIIDNAWVSYGTGTINHKLRRKLLRKYKRKINGSLIEVVKYK